MIAFAGVDLSTPSGSGDLAGLLARYWHGRRVEEFDHPAYLTHGIDHLPIPYPPKREPPRLGVLVWPTGASRWGQFAQLIDGDRLAAVRSAVGTGQLGTLKIDDGTTSISPQMYVLPARPVAQKGTEELYLLTLVDERYFWWLHGDQAAPSSPASWSALLSSLFTSVGVTPTLPSISSNYGTPDPTRWNVGYKPMPLLIDAACATVGLRVKRGLGGTVTVVLAADANAADSANWTANRYECLTGGRLAVADVGRNVPAEVAVVFPGGTPAVSTASLGTLVIPDYAGATGLANTVAQVNADLAAVAALSARSNYANQAATDYYLWALSLTDATFRGVVNWAPTGQEDRIEWDHSSPDVLTRVLRDPFADRNVYGDRRTSDDTLLVQLVGVCWPGTAGAGALPADANCAPDGGCGGRYYQYSAVEVVDSGASPGPPCPVTYAYPASPRVFGPGCTPLYHVRDILVPVNPAGVAAPVCGAGSAAPSGSIAPLAVFRARKGDGDFYLFDGFPYVDLARRTGTTDVDGQRCFIELYDQHDGTWHDTTEIRVIEPP